MKRIKTNSLLPISVLMILFIIQWADSIGQERSDLKMVRQEIERLEKELKTKENREKTLLEQLEDVNREIGLKNKLVDQLDRQRQETERQIDRTEERLSLAIQDYEELKEWVKQRMIAMYKRGRISEWEILFSTNSLNQAALWLRYQKRIMENDERSIRLLFEKKRWIETDRMALVSGLEEKNQLIGEKKRETDNLKEKKEQRNRMLSRIQQDKETILEALQEKRKSFRKIENRIREEEAKRRTATVSRKIITNSKFASNKGSLDWPIRGNVVSKYGRQLHPVLKTWTTNLGIDIRGSEGAAVHTVARGIIRSVYFLRGMGNLVLLDHGEGFYTVYGYLDQFYVVEGDELKEGDVIGKVGNRNSLFGSDLHFQIWNGGVHYDPEAWLR